ncbi:hypothetical protein [Salinarchaeum laminariae]|uniref:hypothetical protein n=1 Tax=Salinarchaeum laminariae TaxID=869888 RepID=UPI0020BF26A2|nr:hypothetical protein [Salinarchaeum laminariae]
MNDPIEWDRSGTVALAGGTLLGIAYAIGVTWYANRMGYPILDVGNPVVVFAFCVLIVAGMVPALALIRGHVVTPGLVLGIATYTWITSEGDPGPGDPLAGFLYLMPFWIGLMAVLGVGERRVRTATLRVLTVDSK